MKPVSESHKKRSFCVTQPPDPLMEESTFLNGLQQKKIECVATYQPISALLSNSITRDQRESVLRIGAYVRFFRKHEW